MTIYRPSARVNLVIRTEEFGDTAALEARLPPPTQVAPNLPSASPPPPVDPRSLDPAERAAELERVQRSLRILTGQRDTLSPAEYVAKVEELKADRAALQRASIEAAAGTATGQRPPEAVAGTAPDDLTVVGDIKPLTVSIERNGLATADTCTVTLDGIDAPFDPRLIRSAFIEVIVGVVPAEDFEAGVERGERRDDGSLVSVVGKSPDGTFRGATRFVGFVDDWAVKYAISGDRITLECRDTSALLRDAKFAGEGIDLSVPVDQGVAEFISRVCAQAAGVVVRYEGEGDAPAPAEATGAPSRGRNQRRRGRRGRRARRARSAGSNMTVWDHITDVCRAAGFIPTVRGFEVVIVEARTLYGSAGSKRMVYGRNLEELTFSRKLQGTKVPTIEVRSYDTSTGRTRWARYPVREGEQASGVLGVDNPPRPLRANEVTPSGANPAESIQTIQVSGTSDPAVLERVARNAFEQIGRQEIEGTMKTKDPSSYGVEVDDVDILDAQAGDAIEVLIAAGGDPVDLDPNTSLGKLQAFTRQRRRDYLIGLGWDSRVADRFAALQEATEFQTTFRAQDVRIEWDNEMGLSISMGFVNFITVREEAS